MDIEQTRIYGWRTALSIMTMGFRRTRKKRFTMRSAIENQMTQEDFGQEASSQDWTDLNTLREQLRWWESTIYNLGHPAKERDRWTQVPPREYRKKARPRHRDQAAAGSKKGVFCFHARTRVRIFTLEKGAIEYKRMDKLVKRDKLWSRQHIRDNPGPSQGRFSTVKCVMTFACPPKGQVMLEVEGNCLTPDHYVARGNGTWTTAGKLTPPGGESSTPLAHLVYNIRLQEGDHIELGNRIYAATLGASFDTTGSEKESTYSEEDARYVQELPGYASGHIH